MQAMYLVEYLDADVGIPRTSIIFFIRIINKLLINIDENGVKGKIKFFN